MRQIALFLILNFTFFNQLDAQKTYNITSAKDKIKVDGVLDEESWLDAEIAKDFIVNYPDFGAKPSFDSEFKLTYSDDALYFSGQVFDTPDSVSYQLSQRDNFGNGDWVSIIIDPYGKNLNAFAFYVTASGVELDALYDGESQDFSWNSVWKSKVIRTETGWQFEMRIPYSAIRFPNKEVQDWNINFKRQVRRKREMSYWNPVDPALYGEITQNGKLKGIKNIKPPLRLSFSPFGITYVESNYNNPEGTKQVQSRTTGGMDLKWGLNDAFTLDMTLIPDFGQTISDNQVLNLGPFEIQFDENRSFFKEGTDLFGIGNVFYSRRIGERPYSGNGAVFLEAGETILESASKAPLLNGTKISGRTNKGLGVGVFNAIEGRTESILEDSLGNLRSVETNPLTNYNVTVFSQNFSNNGKVSFLNTNVLRDGLARDANVSVLNSQFFTKNRDYTISSTFKVSDRYQAANHDLGHNASVYIGKVQGSWRYGGSYYEESDTYNPNDLGFLFANNSRGMNLEGSYNDFKPKGRFLRKWTNVNINYEELYKPKLYSNLNINWSLAGTFNNFLTAGFNGGFSPFGSVDHFESRNFGIPLNYNAAYRFSGFYSSDYSKKFALDARAGYRFLVNSDQNYYNLSLSPRFQFSPRFFLIFNSSYDYLENDFGYVQNLEGTDDIIIGTRNRDIVTNTLNSEFVFTKRMGLNVRFRHNWQRVSYQNFNSLNADGSRSATNYSPVDENGGSQHNTSFNAFTVDINYRWVFFPGCEMLIFYKNNIFTSVSGLDKSYFGTFDTLFNQPQINSLSLKVQVFVDALYFKPGGLKI